MIAAKDLRKLARMRLSDAVLLYKQGRFDSSVYLCGYAVELGLKARICQTLKWSGYPETNSECQGYSGFKTHDLNVLLHLSGIEGRMRQSYLVEWSLVAAWTPEWRYRPIGTANRLAALQMIDATRRLMRTI